ncbi:GDSL esterase/lipase, partial [Thalictrum thalictroides]
SYLRIKSPIPYKWRKIGKEPLQSGMNFAYGGTGVFNTFVTEPNMTTQIDFFQTLIQEGVYTKHDLSSSIALVSLAGNDYSTYTSTNGSVEGLPSFITSVTNQLVLDIKRIYALGVRKVAVTALQPLGCLPQSTVVSSFQTCNGEQNTFVNFHNQLLQEAVVKLNNSTKDSAFVILDFYNAFMSVFNRQKDKAGSLKFQNPLTPCCLGISNQYSCGSVDGHGVKQYRICNDPKSAFFWDTVHPTQQGWAAVYSALRGSLNQLYY